MTDNVWKSISGWAVIIPEVAHGAGRHLVYLDPPEVATTGLHLNFATQGIYLWAIGLVKISIGLFLIRFATSKGYKIFIWTIIGKCRAKTIGALWQRKMNDN